MDRAWGLPLRLWGNVAGRETGGVVRVEWDGRLLVLGPCQKGPPGPFRGSGSCACLCQKGLWRLAVSLGLALSSAPHLDVPFQQPSQAQLRATGHLGLGCLCRLTPPPSRRGAELANASRLWSSCQGRRQGPGVSQGGSCPACLVDVLDASAFRIGLCSGGN